MASEASQPDEVKKWVWQTAFVLDDFHRVRDPRRMTDEYLELVLSKYDELGG